MCDLAGAEFRLRLSARKFRSTQYGARNAEATALDLSSVRHMINGAEPVECAGHARVLRYLQQGEQTGNVGNALWSSRCRVLSAVLTHSPP